MLTKWMRGGNDAPSDIVFVNWAAYFLNENKDVTAEQFEKWFFKSVINAPSFHATGHVDLFGSSTCDGGCYFGASGGVKEIVFWLLN